LSDGLSGFLVLLPATFIIKAVTALFFSINGEKILTLRNVLGIIPSGIICIVGYSLYEGTVMAGELSWTAITAAFTQTPAYCIQIGASTVLFVVVALLLDKVGFKKMFNK
nr:TIGR04002 family protein [Ruminococcus sp.]